MPLKRQIAADFHQAKRWRERHTQALARLTYSGPLYFHAVISIYNSTPKRKIMPLPKKSKNSD